MFFYIKQSLGKYIPFVVLLVILGFCVFQHYRLRFLLILYLNEATEGAFFMSFGRSFQARIVEGKKELENKLVCTL